MRRIELPSDDEFNARTSWLPEEAKGLLGVLLRRREALEQRRLMVLEAKDKRLSDDLS